MFDQMKTLGAIAGLMRNKEQLRAAGERIRAEAERLRVSGDAGAGAVRATATGTLKIVAVELDPALCAGLAGDDAERRAAQDLIVEAVNDAGRKAQEAMRACSPAEARELWARDAERFTARLATRSTLIGQRPA